MFANDKHNKVIGEEGKSMFGSKKKKLLKVLEGVIDPAQARIDGLEFDKGHVTLALVVEPDKAPEMEALRQKAEEALVALEGVEKVTAVLTAEQADAQSGSPMGRRPEPAIKNEFKQVIAVASGKGGVGKSTVAVNLAVALAQSGQKVGLLDADIYGPSVPMLMGLQGQGRPALNDDNQMIPFEAFGVKLMSIGFLVPPGKSVAWRGAMVHKSLLQMFGNVAWGALDTLVIDMPPGTGDAQITIAQNMNLAGAVIVSTPQDLALIDARKGIEMFGQVDVPMLGVVENMSSFICPSCGHESAIFGCGGAEEEARALDVPFLGKIPLHMSVRESADAGTPLVAQAPDGEYAALYSLIAAKMMEQLSCPPEKTTACQSGTCGCK